LQHPASHKVLILAMPILNTLNYLNELDPLQIHQMDYEILRNQAQSSDFFKPITTIYLKIDLTKHLSNNMSAQKFMAILNHPAKNSCAIGDAFFFKPPHLQNSQDMQKDESFISVVYSAAQYTSDEAIDTLQNDLQKVNILLSKEVLQKSIIKVICEKRATFHANPEFNQWQYLFKQYAKNIANFQEKTNGLIVKIAGDYLHPDYPATLESAIISGEEAIQSVWNY
jgi:hypothetical protein